MQTAMQTPAQNRTTRPRRRQGGMTILEIMIVLAIIALVMGFLIGPKIMKMFGDSKVDITRMQVKEYADSAYLMWQKNHQGSSCPASLGDLNEYTNRKTKDGKPDIADAWGVDMTMLCGQNLPPGARGLAVFSNGEDGKPNTSDDIKSWE
jgi:prepilin-type N-terminal cleavage/methylation domain-containing protein